MASLIHATVPELPPPDLAVSEAFFIGRLYVMDPHSNLSKLGETL